MKKIIIYLTLIVTANFAYTNTINVSSIAAMQLAINTASSGDTIILANGTYLNNTLTITNNTITIQAETPGGVFLNGTNAITLNGNYVTFSGFQFTSGSSTGSAITVNGSNNSLMQLNFNGYSASHMILINGSYNLVTNCNFQNKPAPNLVNHGGTGDMVQIIPNATVIGYNTIRYCSFQHMPGFGGDYGNEGIRIGDGAYSTYISRTVVEYCYFEDTGNGDSEAISVKSRENCLRFNTMNNNPNAMFSFRNGDNNVAYSNFFIKSGGIRCKQSNNIYCYNNYFEQSGSNQNTSLPGSGTAPIIFDYFGTGYGANFNIVHNTFYKCTDSKIATGLTNCTWANNIFFSDFGTIFTGVADGQNFAGNIYQGTIGISITSGMTNDNPLLLLFLNGYYVLSPLSPAIGTASSSYPSIPTITGLNNDPSILKDFEGQIRPSAIPLKDVGCDQYSSETINNRPLALCNTGPSYLCTPLSTENTIKDANNLIIYPNPTNGLFYIKSARTISEIKIVNIFGETIYTFTNNTQSSLSEINMSSQPKGIYFVQITDINKKVLNKKIIVQ